jgi:hypothetical protein
VCFPIYSSSPALHSKKLLRQSLIPARVPAVGCVSNLAGLTCDNIPSASAHSTIYQRNTSHKACRVSPGWAYMPSRRTPGSQIADELEPITMIPVYCLWRAWSPLRKPSYDHSLHALQIPFLLAPNCSASRAVPSRFFLSTSAGSKYPMNINPDPLARC